jgi:hypothetical protein
MVVLLLLAVGLTAHLLANCREGLKAHKSQEPTRAPRMGLPRAPDNEIPSLGQEISRFPGVPFSNDSASQAVMGQSKGMGPQAPSATLSQLLGWLQPLGSAPDLGGGDGAPVGSTGLGGSGMMAGPGGADAASGSAIGSGTRGHGPGGHGGQGGHGGHGAQSALPPGIHHSKIPPGQEHLYILKSEIVPPVCPACPACPQCPKPVCPKPDPSQCPPCPAPGRCPPPAFGCQRVALYQNMQSGVLPTMLG